MSYRQPFKGDYAITQDFGELIPGVTYNNKPHNGIDYACPIGTPVLASDDGIVMTVGDATTGYGKYIILCHIDGSGTVYAHLDTIYFRQWQSVKKGEVIGTSGNTGNSTGPHLHFEYRRKANDYTTAEDPKPHLQNVFDADPIDSTPAPAKPQFDTVAQGICVVVCDYANVRCHCDMDRIIGMKKKGDIISIGDQVTMFHGLPYRDYYDAQFNCWLRIAEHDPDTQMIRNYDPKLEEIDYSDGTWHATP